MIYVATVHWKNDRWIRLQHEYLTRYFHEPFRVFAFLNDIPQEFYSYFHSVRDNGDPTHAQKLNTLAQEITRESKSASDILVFIDGDAFPIAPLDQWMKERLSKYPLIAVQRIENIGDIQPHPCFCVTTVGFWNSIHGDWNEGYTWELNDGDMQTDVGGNLLQILEEKSISWLPLHRTNTVNLNALMFGVYDNVVYHHGAGFRFQKGGRVSVVNAGKHRLLTRLDIRVLEKCIPRPFLLKFRLSIFHPFGRMRRKLFRKLTLLSDRVYQKILDDPQYVYTFIEPETNKVLSGHQSEND